MPATRPRSTRNGAPSSRACRTQPNGAEHGPSWQRRDWPVVANGELVAALDGNWAALEADLGKKIKAGVAARGAEISDERVQQAARDSVRAIMMIRAYRMRGHFYANLDPLGLEPPKTDADLDPASYGFTEADYGRKIFIDHVLGLEFATVPRDARHPPADLLRHARHRVHAHLRPGREELDPGAHRGPGQGHRLHAGGQEGDPQQARRGRRLREVHRRQVHRHQALRPRRRRSR